MNSLRIVVVGTNVRSSAVILVEHGQAEVALRGGTFESENRNAYAACFTMSSPSAEALSLLDEQDAYGVLSESKRVSEHSYSRSIIMLVVSILPILFGETGTEVDQSYRVDFLCRSMRFEYTEEAARWLFRECLQV